MIPNERARTLRQSWLETYLGDSPATFDDLLESMKLRIVGQNGHFKRKNLQ
jgi:hypothetical protein